MDRRLISGLALAAGLGLVACSEQPQELDSPDLAEIASFVTPCNTNGFNPLIAGYFSGTQQQLVKDYKDAMLDALAASQAAAAETQGFNVLREIASAAKGAPQPPAATGSALAVETLRCIVEVTDTNVIKPASPGLTFFIPALDHDAGGGFEVRGGAGDPTAPVQADAGTSPLVISGIAPPQGGSWDASLDGQRVLFYGEPGPTAGTYHWSTVRRSATFDPPLVVTTCVDDATFDQPFSVMLHESDVGILAFVDASYIGCGQAPATASAGGTGLFRQLADLGRRLFAPEPAIAAAVMPGLVGGSVKGVKSLFSPEEVTTLVTTLTSVPSPIGTLVVNQGTFDLTVEVREDGDLVNGVQVTLTLEANNGTTNSVQSLTQTGCDGGMPTGVTGAGSFPNGTVIFQKNCITKTGAVKVVVSLQAVGRSATDIAKTAKIKVIPR
jgi:hypothetical protein